MATRLPTRTSLKTTAPAEVAAPVTIRSPQTVTNKKTGATAVIDTDCTGRETSDNLAQDVWCGLRAGWVVTDSGWPTRVQMTQAQIDANNALAKKMNSEGLTFFQTRLGMSLLVGGGLALLAGGAYLVVRKVRRKRSVGLSGYHHRRSNCACP